MTDYLEPNVRELKSRITALIKTKEDQLLDVNLETPGLRLIQGSIFALEIVLEEINEIWKEENDNDD